MKWTTFRHTVPILGLVVEWSKASPIKLGIHQVILRPAGQGAGPEYHVLTTDVAGEARISFKAAVSALEAAEARQDVKLAEEPPE